MSRKLAIKGHPTRGNEIIEILKMLGGSDDGSWWGNDVGSEYFINDWTQKIDVCTVETDIVVFTLEEFLEKYPFKVGDKVVYEDDNDIVVISEIKWDNTVGDIFYNVKRIDEDDCFLCPPELLKSYKEIQNENMETKTHRGYYTTEEETANKSKKVAWFTFWDNDFADKVELNLNDRELIQENGKWFVVKKKPPYPKTVIEVLDYWHPNREPEDNYQDIYKKELIESFQLLLYCRDAYWKIYGEQLGLNGPWEPDWTSGKPFYCISVSGNMIDKGKWYTDNKILAFPTEEMRDVFYENFKDLIEQCKELL